MGPGNQARFKENSFGQKLTTSSCYYRELPLKYLQGKSGTELEKQNNYVV